MLGISLPAWATGAAVRYGAVALFSFVVAWTVQGYRLDAVRAKLASASAINAQCAADVEATQKAWADYRGAALVRQAAAAKAIAAAQATAKAAGNEVQRLTNLKPPAGDTCVAAGELARDYLTRRRK